MQNKYTHLDNCIREFNEYCKLVTQLNTCFKQLLFLYYYQIVPLFDFCIIAMLSLNGQFLISAVSGAVVINFLGGVCMLNICLSSLPRESHRSYSTVHSILCRHKLPISLKLKTVGVVEHLSGRVIGFYCYDLFPFTNYEIYLFCVNCVVNFILFMGLI